MEKSKKASEFRNKLSDGEKVARLPRIGNVEDQLCKQKIPKKYPKAVLSNENYAFEKLKNQRILC